MLADIIKVHAKSGKTMVFTETKKEANEVALSSSISSICQVLHGDIAQKQREITLSSFRNGLFQVLVATDVAARGLDIEGVDLIIQSSPPKDYEHYIHRSGRTGRAGKSGVSITLYSPNKWFILKNIEKQGKFTFTRIGIPQQKDLITSLGPMGVKEVSEVNMEIIPYFLPFAREIIEYYEGNAEHGVAAALAVITKCTKNAKTGSLLENIPGYVTILLTPKFANIRNAAFVQKALTSELSPSDAEKLTIKTIRITKDGGAVADIPESFVEKMLESNKQRPNLVISVISELPPLNEVTQKTNNSEEGFNRTNGYRRNFSGGRRYGGGGNNRGGNYLNKK